MKVVLDTNVFISGIHWSGACEKILYDWFEDKFEVICSEEIIEEIIGTLMNFKVPLLINDLLWWISIIIGKAILVEPEEKIDVVREDRDDNKFIEVGVAGNAQYVISQDKHLLKIREFRRIKVLTPEEFLGLYRA